VPDANYFDLGIQRTVPSHDNYTLFANIENVGNSLNPRNQAATYYDVLGRTFNVGLRVRY
jgi:outer membrane receptor protein involved in Fe transport